MNVWSAHYDDTATRNDYTIARMFFDAGAGYFMPIKKIWCF